jgi:hypothetical protein
VIARAMHELDLEIKIMLLTGAARSRCTATMPFDYAR